MCSASEEEDGGSAALNCGIRSKQRSYHKDYFINKYVNISVVEFVGIPGCSQGHAVCSESKP